MISNYHHFSKQNIEFTRNLYIFTNLYLFKDDLLFFWTYWGNFYHFSQEVAKKIIPKFIHMKKIFWGKRHLGLM
jgi:hypothetical protein